MKVRETKYKNGKQFEVNGYLGVDVNGKRVRVKRKGFQTKRAATDWFNAEKVAFSNGESEYNSAPATSTIYTIQELYDLWLSTYENTVEESTLKKTLETFRLHILPVWGTVQVNDIQPLALQRYINQMQRKIFHYKKVVNYFRKLLSMAVRMDIIDVDPFTKIEMPKDKRKTAKPKQFLEVDEFRAFINVLDNEYIHDNRQAATLLRLVAFTGMRTEEVLALQWKHVDFKGNRIKIEQALGRGLEGTYIKGTKSESSNRTIPVAEDMMEKLQDWFQLSDYSKKSDYVFQHRGNTLQVLRPNKWLHDVAEQYSVAVDISVHKLRHTWPTLALSQGASVKQVQGYLGHADAQITLNIYSELTKEQEQQTGEVLTSLLS